MCELCSDNEVIAKPAKSNKARVAERLEHLANFYYLLGQGEICIHSDAAKKIAPTAKAVLKELVNDWV